MGNADGTSGGGGRNLGLLVLVVALAAVLAVGAVMVGLAALGGQKPPDAGAGPKVGGAQAIAAIMDGAARLMQQREYDKAEVILAAAIKEHPFDADLRRQHAESLVALQRYKDAYAEYEALIALANPSPHAKAAGAPVSGGGAPKPIDARLQFEAGTVASKAGLLDRAEEHYSMAQSGAPGEAKYPLYLAMVQIKRQERQEAIASLVRAVHLNPDLAEAWGTLAELALGDNQLGLAQQHVERAITLQPEAGRWRLVKAKVLKRSGRADDVQKAATMLLALDPTERRKPEVLETLAECYGLLKRPADAAAMYIEAAKTDPTDADLAYQAALWSQRAGDDAGAMTWAKTAAMLGSAEARDMVKGK
jgi:tetratricopeptide (TPR) repeat protein